MSKLYSPINELTRIAAVGESISSSFTYLTAITTNQSNDDTLRRLTRTEFAVRGSMMYPSESGLFTVGTVVPHHPNTKTHYSTWIDNVTKLNTNLQNQLEAHNDSPIQLTYIERKEQSVDRDLEDRLEFPVKFVPRGKSRHREDLDPFTTYLILFANKAATIFRKDGDLVLSYPLGTEFENLALDGYGIKDSLDAELNRRSTK